jgi:hypothetical protein
VDELVEDAQAGRTAPAPAAAITPKEYWRKSRREWPRGPMPPFRMSFGMLSSAFVTERAESAQFEQELQLFSWSLEVVRIERASESANE